MADQHKDESGDSVPALLVGTPLQDPLTVGSTSVQSNAINAKGSSGTRMVAVYYKSTDDECHFAVGLNPTASTNDRPLAKRVDQYFTVKNGDKLAFIANSTANAENGGSGGSLFITQI